MKYELAKDMTSYQKLKKHNKEQEEYIKRLLTEPEFYIKESLIFKCGVEAIRSSWFGDANSQPSGIFNPTV